LTKIWRRNIDYDIFNIENGGKITKIQVYSVDNSKIGVYNLRIVGKFTPLTNFEAISYFKATIRHQCVST
jgi:hypothetical protein